MKIDRLDDGQFLFGAWSLKLYHWATARAFFTFCLG